MVICLTLFYLNSIVSLYIFSCRLDPLLLLDPAHLAPIVETPKCVQAANNGVQRPTQVFLTRVTVA